MKSAFDVTNTTTINAFSFNTFITIIIIVSITRDLKMVAVTFN